jgi:hypothetical protein
MPAGHSSFLVQSSHGGIGNFEVVVPRIGGGLAHYWRDNDDPMMPWIASNVAFGSTDDVHDVALVQGPFGASGNLEVVLIEGSYLVHNWRDDGGSWRWQARTYLPGGVPVAGGVALIHSSHGTIGNLEVVASVAPAAGGGLAHWWRDNDGNGLPWHGPTIFGSGTVEAVAMVQSTFGPAGNLELLARVGDQLIHYWRDDGASWAWNGPFPIPAASGVVGDHVLLQTTYGTPGTFELVAPLAGGGLGHWTRHNDHPALPWTGPVIFGQGIGTVDAVAMIQSTFGQPGNLEIIARVGEQLFHGWRDAGLGAWFGPFHVAGPAALDPAAAGECTIPYKPPVVAIHAALAHTGKLALFGLSDHDATMGALAALDLATGAAHVPSDHHHLFCSGHAFLPDGTLLIMGGHYQDVTSVHTFDPDTEQWTHIGQMEHGRWYPTCTALPNGQVLTMSGTQAPGGPVSPATPVNNTLQVYDPFAGLQPEQPLPSPFSDHFPPSFPTIDLYPFVYVLPSEQLLVHSRNVTRFYDPATGDWSPEQLPAAYPHSRTYPGEGSSVLLPLLPESSPPYRARVLNLGGGGADPEVLDMFTPATASAEILDLGEPAPAWRFTASMHWPRVMPDATLLPDGTVLVMGGSATGRADMGLDPVLDIELFDPISEMWALLSPMKVPRSYHSTAILLPDGRVLIGGKDGLFNMPPYDYPEHRLEAFSPPYLFRGPRPVIASAPSSVGYGSSFAVDSPDAGSISSAVLLRAGSVTHSYNMEQRLVGLVIGGQSGTTLTLQAPPGPNIAPPGYYLLFLLNGLGVPSVAEFVQLA